MTLLHKLISKIHKAKIVTHDKFLALKKKITKKRLIFIVENTEYWMNFHSIYKALKRNRKLHLIVLICPIIDPRLKDDWKIRYVKIEKFLQLHKIKFQPGIIEGNYVELPQFSPALVFFQHPYDCLRDPKYHSSIVTEYTKIAYVTYGFMLSQFENLQYTNPFFKYIHKIYVESEYYRMNFAKNFNSEWIDKVCVVSGHPKLDYYTTSHNEFNNYWPRHRSKHLKRIILSPHWTIKRTKEDGSEVDGYSQFWTFKDIYLELPTRYPSVDFLFRPHPLLYNELVVQKLMTEEEVNAYKIEFSSHNNAIVDNGALDYFKSFSSSDALITDGVSFLAEYLPSQKPILHIVTDTAMRLNEFGKLLTANYYKAKQKEDLFNFIERVVINEDDYLYEQRISDMKKFLFQPARGSGRFIAQDIKKLLLK